ncbi:hypothetical protein GIB67_011817 [Kingdonia uniflora]|uniref:Uncharacterized protein n=1 Tax=Kingdonia uniflora TaxID=39325 RepID=A0A7J7NXV3_9MAGN|nr:hypothetical protein GIB67_011817 [Kingdonia uniflora]
MALISGCAKADKANLVGHFSPIIGVGVEEDTVAELIEWPRLKGSRVEYPAGSSWFREFCNAKSSIDGIWGHAFVYRGINCKVSRKEYFIDVVSKEGTELEAVLKELVISRFNRVAGKDDKLARLNEIPDRPVDMTTVSSTVVRNLAKRKAVKRWVAPHSVSSVSVDNSSKRRRVISPTKSQEMLKENDKIAEGADLRLRFEVEADLLEEQCRAKAREKMVAVMDDEFKKEMEIMDEEEVEERECGLNTAEKANADNQETINQEIENSHLRVVDLEGLLEVEKKSSAGLQKELDAVREREEQTLLYNVEYVEEYEALISQDLALNKLTSELAELKEKDALGSRHEAELAEYRIRALNEEISDMKCNIRALNELLLKREIDLDTAQTNLAVSEADFEKLSSSIVGKDRELRNSEQICDSLISRDCEISSCEGSRDMKEFLHQKEELVENMRIDLANSRQKSIDLTRQMGDRIDQLTAEQAE